jgi:hypothetical protein
MAEHPGSFMLSIGPKWLFSGQRPNVIVTVVCILPLLVIVTFSAPCWFILPFLSRERREAIFKLMDQMITWVKTILENKHNSPDTEDTVHTSTEVCGDHSSDHTNE